MINVVNASMVLWRTLGLIVGLGLLAGAGAFVGNPALNVAAQHQQVSAAEPIEATVLTSETGTEVLTYRRVSGSPANRKRWTSETITRRSHYVVVQFQYTVDGETYESVNFGPPGTAELGTHSVENQTTADRIVSQYPENETVTAYYLPDDPGTAFLRTEAVNPVWLLSLIVPTSLPAVFGALFVGGSLGLVASDGTWKSRVGGYLLTLFMTGPITGIVLLGVAFTPKWLNLPVVGVGVLLFASILYYTSRMMFLGHSAREVGLFDESDYTGSSGE